MSTFSQKIKRYQVGEEVTVNLKHTADQGNFSPTKGKIIEVIKGYLGMTRYYVTTPFGVALTAELKTEKDGLSSTHCMSEKQYNQWINC